MHNEFVLLLPLRTYAYKFTAREMTFPPKMCDLFGRPTSKYLLRQPPPNLLPGFLDLRPYTYLVNQTVQTFSAHFDLETETE